MILDNFEQDQIEDYSKNTIIETEHHIIHKYVVMTIQQYNELIVRFNSGEVVIIDGERLVCSSTKNTIRKYGYIQFDEIKYVKVGM